MERMSPNRPLTHDLFKNTLETFNVELKEVIISNLLDGIFYARLICYKGEEVIEIDSRTSDALALAVRFECSIYTYEFILDAAGVVLENDETTESPELEPVEIEEEEEKNPLSSLSLKDLQKMLNEVLADENYERAAQIRDELQRRGH